MLLCCGFDLFSCVCVSSYASLICANIKCTSKGKFYSYIHEPAKKKR